MDWRWWEWGPRLYFLNSSKLRTKLGVGITARTRLKGVAWSGTIFLSLFCLRQLRSQFLGVRVPVLWLLKTCGPVPGGSQGSGCDQASPVVQPHTLAGNVKVCSWMPWYQSNVQWDILKRCREVHSGLPWVWPPDLSMESVFIFL